MVINHLLTGMILRVNHACLRISYKKCAYSYTPEIYQTDTKNDALQKVPPLKYGKFSSWWFQPI